MESDKDHDYQMGVRDGKIASLEKTVEQIAADLNKFRIAMYMLYGAIAMVQFMPFIERLLTNARQ